MGVAAVSHDGGWEAAMGSVVGRSETVGIDGRLRSVAALRMAVERQRKESQLHTCIYI